MCTDEECSGESASPSTSDTRQEDFSLSYTLDEDLDVSRTLKRFKFDEETSAGTSGLQRAAGKLLEELPSTCKVSADNGETPISSCISSFSKAINLCQEDEDTTVVIHNDKLDISEHADQLSPNSVSTDATGSQQELVDFETTELGARVPLVTSRKRRCLSFMRPLPLSPKDTEAFDEMKSLKAIQDSASLTEHMTPSLSSDLQNVDTTPFVKEELKEKIQLRRKIKGLPQLKVQEQYPKRDILTAEEIEKRRVRRERNRIAAAKCRRKKRSAAKEHDKVKQQIQEQNLALLNELHDLLDEKGQLQAMLRNHLKECTNSNLPPVDVLQPQGARIRTSLDLDFAILSESVDEEMDFIGESSDSDSIDLTDDIDDEIMASSIIAQDESNPSHLEGSLTDAVNMINQIDFSSLEFSHSSF